MSQQDANKLSATEKLSVAHSAAGDALVGALTANILIAWFYLFSHACGWAFCDGHSSDDYSLKNRMETAYCFDTPHKHKYYITNNNKKSQYMVSPFVTYSLAVLMTSAFAKRGARRKRQNILKSHHNKQRQH